MKAIKFSKKINLEKLKTQHTIGKTPSKVFESAWYVSFFVIFNFLEKLIVSYFLRLIKFPI